jgi:hypothetical protein
MSVKGNKKEQKEFTKELFVGFTSVKVVAVNPSREEINKLVGREGDDTLKEMTYLGVDQDNNDRLRLSFWLEDMKTGRMFVHSFHLTNRGRVSKDEKKVQIINSTCNTSWAPLIEGTDKVDESLIQSWFSNFTDKQGKILGPKKWRKALSGEEELVILLRVWLGRIKFLDTETEVLIDTKKLFKENYKELRELISLDANRDFTEEGYDTPFVILAGVRTDGDDPNKKYQQVWGKGFLPADYLKHITVGGIDGPKFSSEYNRKQWKRFKEEVTGDYGFDGYTELVPLVEYDVTKDITGGMKVAKEVPSPHSSEY